MELYFAPLACSLATRIALYEAGAPARYTQADTHTKKLLDGSDFFAINPMGQVPALRLDDGSVLTENTAILQYVAEQFPQARLAPAGGRRAQQHAAVARLHRHRAAQGDLHSVAGRQGVGRGEGVRPRQDRAAHGASCRRTCAIASTCSMRSASRTRT